MSNVATGASSAGIGVAAAKAGLGVASLAGLIPLQAATALIPGLNLVGLATAAISALDLAFVPRRQRLLKQRTEQQFQQGFRFSAGLPLEDRIRAAISAATNPTGGRIPFDVARELGIAGGPRFTDPRTGAGQSQITRREFRGVAPIRFARVATASGGGRLPNIITPTRRVM